ncbi:MAG TPA: hypothetical protein VFC41_05895 [Anaerovoracaceae bacterium]|nr:hypothetical protein [Anaerovoracaceae bacterium]
MKKSKGMQLGALLAAVLLLSMVFTGAAIPDKEFPKDLPERILLGLNDSQLQDKGIPDFVPEVFENLKKEQKVLDTRGKTPRFETEKERQNWLNKLDKNRISVRDEMRPYLYPKGPVIGYGWSINGYFLVAFYENITIETSQVDEIYAIVDKQAQKTGIQDVPVVFKLEAFPQLDLTGYDARYRPIIGGIQVQYVKSGTTYQSTLGFAAKDASGTKGYVIARHAGNSIGLQIYQPTVSFFNKAGTVSKLGGNYADASFVPYSDVEATIHLGATTTAPVKDYKDPVAGWKIYKSGITTGITSGYTIEKVDQVTQSGGWVLYDQWRADYDSSSGDSGSPVYHIGSTGREIVGIHWGHTSLYSYFSPVSGVKADLGVDPLTR